MVNEGNTSGQHVSVQRFVNDDTLQADGDTATVTADVTMSWQTSDNEGHPVMLRGEEELWTFTLADQSGGWRVCAIDRRDA